MTLDAIIIAETDASSFSATNPLKFSMNGRTADIQEVARALVRKSGPEAKDRVHPHASWASAPKSNGIFLLDYLTKKGIRTELIGNYEAEKERFARLLKRSPKAVILSTTFIAHKQVIREIAEDIRRQAPDIVIIAGGPFVYISYMLLNHQGEDGYDIDSARGQFLFLDVEEEPRVDLYVVSQRGERALAEAMERIDSARRTDAIPNTARLSGGHYVFSPRADDLLDPDRTAIDWAALPDAVFASGVVPLQASTGCTFNCAFCNFIKDRRLNRIRPTEEIVAEMKAVSRRGARYIWFVDDNFRLGKKDLGDVCRRFIREALNLRWMTFVRADALLNEDADLLRDAGCVEVQLGLESADPAILKNMNKGADPETYHRALVKLRTAGINCSCYFIFGFPGETRQSARRTRDFIRVHDRMTLDGGLSVSLFPFILSPLSPIYAPRARKAYDLSGYMKQWRHRTMDSDRAVGEIVQTFLEMENTGAIYRGDDLDMLARLSPGQRAAFRATRHRLAKTALQEPVSTAAAVAAFRKALPDDWP